MIEINEMQFEPNPECKYKHDYAKAVENIKTGKWGENDTWRELILNDLWFIVYFVLKVKGANHPFIVNACREVEEGEKTKTLDLWARGHFKSTIITTAEVLQVILANPESRVGIFSHTRPASKAFLRRIKLTMEGSEILQACFPDVLYAKPETESPKWSLDINTPVLTTKGWKKHGDLQVGDKIFGSKGQVIKVIGNSGIMKNAECRRIKFDDCEMIASSEHLWAVQCVNSKTHLYGNNPKIKICMTDELPIKKKDKRMLPTPSIKFNKKPVKLDPYIFGLWLGDGTAGTNIISMHNDDELEILEQIKLSGFEPYIHRKKEKDNFSMYGLRGLKEIINSIGCLKDKHIPDDYLFNDEYTRLSLLQGLMDSDGTSKKSKDCFGMCMFSNTNKKLADGVFYLAVSLGLRPSICTHMPKDRGHKRIYQIYFVGIKSTPPFRLKRKLNNCKDKRHQNGRYIHAIEKIESALVNCIKVDAPDHLYLAGYSLVPTHNSEDDGMIVKRKGFYNEATLEAWGLVEGTPVGKHFTFRVYDDIETPDMVTTPEVISKLKNMFDVSQNLSDKDARYRIVGTPYHYDGLIQHLRSQKNTNGTLKYMLRLKPATVDSSANGEPVYLSKEELEDLKTTQHYSAQQLLDPTPLTDARLRSDYLKDINPEFIPSNIYKFMVVDPAGDSRDGKGDSWAIHVIGIEPKIDEVGASNVYITDSLISPLNDSEAVESIVRMYINGGVVMQVGIEKMGLSSVEIHVANALKARGRYISVDNSSLVILRPAGRAKQRRILEALHWPLNNGKLFISNRIPLAYRERLRTEMDRFPFWHDDGLDALSYFYDMAKSYAFGMTQNFSKKLRYNTVGII